MAKKTLDDIKSKVESSASFVEYQRNLDLLQKELISLGNIFDLTKKIGIQNDINNEKSKIANLYELEKLKLISKKHTFDIDEENKINNLIANSKKEVELQKKRIDYQKNGLETLKKFKEVSFDLLKNLNTQDKIIRDTIRNLGVSGIKADLMRQSFEKSAMQVSLLGGNLEDIQKIQEGFADETGRVYNLTSDIIKNITEIAYGTGLGIENATKLAAQFNFMGLDVKRVKDLTQSLVDTGELYGINSRKALTNIANNFKKINTYTFRNGSDGIKNMALYAEKMNVSMTSVLDAAETARTLEGAVNLAAKLQVMGGEFAKTDPFEMLFLSRNDPEKFQEKIAEMTKGLFTFKRNSKGIFEEFISPADRDRLKQVSESLGISLDQMIMMGQTQAKLSKMNQDLIGTNYTSKQKEIIKGAALFNSQLGRFEVEIGGIKRDIIKLSSKEIELLTSQKSSLETRAKNALDFESSLKATIEGFKGTLLPILKGVNVVLSGVRIITEPVLHLVDSLTKSEWGRNILKFAGVLLSSSFIFSKAVLPLYGLFTGMKGLTLLGSIKSMFGKSSNTTLRDSSTGRFISRKAAGANAGKGLMRGGIGVGAAALGVGAGIGLAASGVSLLADSLNKLNDKKAEILKDIVNTIGIVTGIGVAAAAAIAIFAKSGALAAPELAAFGAALIPVGFGVSLIGAGIGVATAGIGYMIKGFGDAISGFGYLSTGIGNLVSAFSNLKINSETISAMKTIASVSNEFSVVGDAFQKISTVLSGRKEDFIAIQEAVKSISTMTIAKDSALAQLANSFNKPIKVEFADKNVAIATNITLEIDGEKFMRKVVNQKALVQIMKND